MEELEQVGSNVLSNLNTFFNLYAKGDFEAAIDLGERLLSSEFFDQNQRVEIAEMIDNAKKILNNKEEKQGFHL